MQNTLFLIKNFESNSKALPLPSCQENRKKPLKLQNFCSVNFMVVITC